MFFLVSCLSKLACVYCARVCLYMCLFMVKGDQVENINECCSFSCLSMLVYLSCVCVFFCIGIFVCLSWVCLYIYLCLRWKLTKIEKTVSECSSFSCLSVHVCLFVVFVSVCVYIFVYVCATMPLRMIVSLVILPPKFTCLHGSLSVCLVSPSFPPSLRQADFWGNAWVLGFPQPLTVNQHN